MARTSLRHPRRERVRTVDPLSEQLLKTYGKRITFIDSAIHSNPLAGLIEAGKFSPIIQQTAGDERWAARIRFYDGEFTMHFMNTAMNPIPHPTIKDNGGVAIIQDIDSSIKDNKLSYRIRMKLPANIQLAVMSPETGDKKRRITLKKEKGYYSLDIDLSDMKIYAVAQPAM